MTETQAPYAADAPKITDEHIDSLVISVDYHVFPGTTVTVCCIVLKNGYSVTGESACVSQANFNAEIGRSLAYKEAREKIWQLEGYLLREHLSKNEQHEEGF